MDLPVNSDITKTSPYKICFVCLGNICRSPTAEGIFQHLIEEEQLNDFFEIDSAGTSAYHIGETANNKSQRTANKQGITLDSKARKFDTSDLGEHDLILTMDNENYNNVQQMAGEHHQAKIGRLRDFDPDPGNREVPDPYHGGPEGFENVFHIVKRSCQQLLDELRPHIKQ